MKPSLADVQAQFEALAAQDPLPTPAPAPFPPVPAAPPAAGAPAVAPPAAAAAPAAPSPAPRPQVQVVDFPARGFHLDVALRAAQVVEAARIMERHGFVLELVTGVDWMAQGEMEVVYDFLHFETLLRVAVRVRVPRAAPELPTVREIHPGADWHERETHELLGIRFAGHPNLTPLLLPEDADFHPLRKDYGT